jgi:hypothetical protein
MENLCERLLELQETGLVLLPMMINSVIWFFEQIMLNDGDEGMLQKLVRLFHLWRTWGNSRRVWSWRRILVSLGVNCALGIGVSITRIIVKIVGNKKNKETKKFFIFWGLKKERNCCSKRS